jgi:hypothetical protein
MSMVNAHAHGLPFVYLAPGLQNSITAPTFAVVVAAASPIRGPKDLRGVMAVSGLNNIAQIATARATTRDWIAKNGPGAQRFACAMREIAQWSNGHHGESAPMLAKYTKISLATITHMRRGDFAERFDPALIAPVIDAAVKYGIIATPFRAGEIIFGAP